MYALCQHKQTAVLFRYSLRSLGGGVPRHAIIEVPYNGVKKSKASSLTLNNKLKFTNLQLQNHRIGIINSSLPLIATVSIITLCFHHTTDRRDVTITC